MDTTKASTVPATQLQAPVQFVKDTRTAFRRQLDDLAFGSVAGLVGKFVEYPFDTVKVRLQTQPLDRPLYSGPMNCIMHMLKTEGVKSFYKGMASPLVGSMVENAALFVGYGQVQQVIRAYSMTGKEQDAWRDLSPEERPPLSLSQLVLAGTLSGVIASFVLTPVELVKCKLQVMRERHRPMDVISAVMRQHGAAGFYRGYLATMLREAGGGACWFGFYEYTCAQFIARRQQHESRLVTKADLAPTELMLGGALGGMAYNASLYPVDVIKSHMQTDDVLGAQRQRSFVQTARQIYTTGGINAFYRGCGITVLRSAPTSAIIFMTFELLNRNFGA
ncbi:mitochondrial carrier domain-containing protein [Gongronella butleri]|nr:mitochondrial carrier domain-containing protein [Gongronella butleri]